MPEKKSRPWPVVEVVCAPPHRAKRVSEVKIVPSPAVSGAFQLSNVCTETGTCRFTLGGGITVETDLTSGVELAQSAVQTGELDARDPAIQRAQTVLMNRQRAQDFSLKA